MGDDRIAHFLLVVESFIVEKINFDLDVQKHKHDQTEYNHQRECQNKVMEAKVIEQETKNRKARAETDQEILLSEAKAQSEAKAVASERQHRIEREHLRKMNELETEHLRKKKMNWPVRTNANLSTCLASQTMPKSARSRPWGNGRAPTYYQVVSWDFRT